MLVQYCIKSIPIFDQKLLEGETTHWIQSNHCKLCGATAGHQNQSSLVERSWQMLGSMACAYITDMQLPHTFWFWVIRHTAQVMNDFIIQIHVWYQTRL